MKLYKSFYIHYINYSAPRNLNNSYSLGFILSMLFLMQIVTGFFIIIYYIPHEALAFKSVSYIMKDVSEGWLTRYLHTNTSSLIFVLLYLHIGKNIYYSGFNKNSKFVWISGYLIFLLNIGTSFLGYILPYGQMSYWGATVIFQLVSTIPLIGNRLVLFLWGGYQVNTVTLGRIFSLHYILPFAILSIIIVHLICMHSYIINTPNRWNSKFLMKDYKNITLYPYHINKDYFFFVIFFFILALFVAYYPESLFNPINYVEASPSETPKHIIPEWYFLPLYSILKIIPNKSLGILTMLSFLLLPLISMYFSNLIKMVAVILEFFIGRNMLENAYNILFWFFFLSDYCIYLTNLFLNYISVTYTSFMVYTFYIGGFFCYYNFCFIHPTLSGYFYCNYQELFILILIICAIWKNEILVKHQNLIIYYLNYFVNSKLSLIKLFLIKMLYKIVYHTSLITKYIKFLIISLELGDEAIIKNILFLIIILLALSFVSNIYLERYYNYAIKQLVNNNILLLELNSWVKNYSIFIATFIYLMDIGYWPTTAIIGSYGSVIVISFYLGWIYFYKSEKYMYFNK